MPIDGTITYEVEVVRNALIPAEGCELAADLYLPKGAPPVPALIMLLPYNKDWSSGAEAWQSNHYFARCGYASVMVDLRGTGSSSGTARAPFHGTESDDGVAAIEWAAKQGWCNGQVGMWGISYGGVTSMRTASRQPQALRAIVPIMGHLDPERDFVHPDGGRGCLAPLTWGLENLLLQLTPPMHMDAAGRWRKVWDERLQRAEPYFTDLLRYGPDDPAWRSRAIDATRIAVPSLCVVGWRDLFVEGMTRAYEQIQAPKRLLAGPWMHVLPHASPFCTIDFLPIMRRWWDRWLRGIQNGVEHEPPVTVFMQESNRWCKLSAWPPVEATQAKWFTRSVGTLETTSGSIVDVAQRPPDATIGVGSGLQYFPSSGFGLPVDQSEDDRRGISFTSAQLETVLPILGRAELRLQLKSGKAFEGMIVAKLSDVHPDGRSVLITAGIANLSKSRSDGILVIGFAPTGYGIASGHQLRLNVANGDFPRLWPDSNLSELLVSCGGAEGTQLDLPIVPANIGPEAHLEAADAKSEVPPQLLKADPPEYEVTRDPIKDSVTVNVAFGQLLRSTDSINTLRMKTFLSASVEAGNPAEARFTGRGTIEVSTPQGPIRVSANVSVSENSATIEGEIVSRGQTTFAQRWSV